MSEKSQWGSKLGFILASAGSAIGLGAVWKFPYMTAANGGGGFLLVFLISTLLIGFPLLLAEFALGRSAGVSAIKTFGKLGDNKNYNFIGWIGAFALFILLSFYSVIGGWVVSLLLKPSNLGLAAIMPNSLQTSFQILGLPLGLKFFLSSSTSLSYLRESKKGLKEHLRS